MPSTCYYYLDSFLFQKFFGYTDEEIHSKVNTPFRTRTRPLSNELQL